MNRIIHTGEEAKRAQEHKPGPRAVPNREKRGRSSSPPESFGGTVGVMRTELDSGTGDSEGGNMS